jgi:DNA-binding Lrp family transcriptional regulator
MLDRLLALLRNGGTQGVDDLATKLKVTRELVLAMLEGLEDMGYLRQIGPVCVEKCTAFSMAKFCAANTRERAWIVTEKAERHCKEYAPT